jgi:hypothetical protein
VKETVLQLTPLEVFFIVTTFLSLFLNLYQFMIWRRDQKTLFRPLSNAVIALFNDIKLKATNVYLAQQVLYSPNSPHKDITTLRWEYGAFTQSVLAYLQGFQEALVGILATMNPDDPEGERVFRAAEYGLTGDERELRRKNLERLQQGTPIAPSPQAQASAMPSENQESGHART